MDAVPSPDSLKDLKADLTEQFRRGDKRVTDALTREIEALAAKSESQHTTLMAEVRTISAWIAASDQAKGELDRQTRDAERLKAEQEQKQLWLAEQAATAATEKLAQDLKDAAALKARHDRWAPYVTATLGMAAAGISGSVFYLLNNLATLRWALPSQLSAGIIVASIVLAWALFKWSP